MQKIPSCGWIHVISQQNTGNLKIKRTRKLHFLLILFAENTGIALVVYCLVELLSDLKKKIVCISFL